MRPLVCIEQRLMIIKYNIARDGSLCRTLQNIKTTSIYFYLFFYFPITGPESPYKTFCNENISSNPFKALLHISNFISCLDQILFRNNFCKFVSWKKLQAQTFETAIIQTQAVNHISIYALTFCIGKIII